MHGGNVHSDLRGESMEHTSAVWFTLLMSSAPESKLEQGAQRTSRKKEYKLIGKLINLNFTQVEIEKYIYRR